MEGSEVLDIECLYAFERVQLRWRGLRLYAILKEAVIGGGYDEETDTHVPERNFGNEGMLLLCFKARAEGSEVTTIFPMSQLMVEDVNDWLAEYLFEQAASAMISLVENGIVYEDYLEDD